MATVIVGAREFEMRFSLLFLALGFCSSFTSAVAADARPNVRPPERTAPDQSLDGTLLLAADVEQLLKDNTSEGFMLSGGNYREYYAADGTVVGNTYKGSWWMKEDAICMSYPGINTYCYRVRKLQSGAIVWELDGEPSGYARILSGNHFKF
ncbi:hypothetical protein [uncultured Hyphomicrobium sp.]|uniref:hypothetical protein n=1 Tax=uncultured Hyphomicrobium sp. TaxID=194373 RepID=UPI0025CC56AD|nr:hypothetical protein [uncultured Hyphomicrobium sp.]